MTEAVDAVLLLGPTATGKSALAMRIAEKIPVEIVAVDSAQVYRGMDIGTAKPSAADRAAVPHHLIDLRDPSEPYSAAAFVADAACAIEQIRARGRLPLLVGGTMLYAKALREGLSSLPSADTEIRERIESDASALGWPALHARLAQIDGPTATRVKPNDSQRIQRALEVFEATGLPMSELLSVKKSRPVKVNTIALLPPDRPTLHRRIEQRFDAMLNAGLLDEVRSLHARGDLHAQFPSIRSVGYRQAWAFLESKCTYEEFRASAIAATRQLAKRQMTWLRSMRDARFIEPTAEAALREILASFNEVPDSAEMLR